jgi:hypothetical protein
VRRHAVVGVVCNGRHLKVFSGQWFLQIYSCTKIRSHLSNVFCFPGWL